MFTLRGTPRWLRSSRRGKTGCGWCFVAIAVLAILSAAAQMSSDPAALDHDAAGLQFQP